MKMGHVRVCVLLAPFIRDRFCDCGLYCSGVLSKSAPLDMYFLSGTSNEGHFCKSISKEAGMSFMHHIKLFVSSIHLTFEILDKSIILPLVLVSG